jgi:hypothetical protein
MEIRLINPELGSIGKEMGRGNRKYAGISMRETKK